MTFFCIYINILLFEPLGVGFTFSFLARIFFFWCWGKVLVKCMTFFNQEIPIYTRTLSNEMATHRYFPEQCNLDLFKSRISSYLSAIAIYLVFQGTQSLWCSFCNWFLPQGGVIGSTPNFCTFEEGFVFCWGGGVSSFS